MNDEFLRKSDTLNGYTAIVEHIRHNQRKGMELSAAARETINWGLSQGILSTFLKEHTGVNNMLMTEFNIDLAKEVWQEEAREDLLEIIEEKDALIAKLQATIEELKNK
ncbi:MAG: hypothetical protein FWD44_05090, partial [Oscillospiraceae bacterium]|nr:hypothetical protein [Oscillospiraceae bacterium]